MEADQRCSLAGCRVHPQPKMRQAADEPAACRLFLPWFGLEVKAYLCRQSTRCDIVRTTERRKEVVQRVFVGDVYGCQAEAPFTFVAVEEIVLAERHIEEIALGNPRRVVVVVLRAGCGYRNQL